MKTTFLFFFFLLALNFSISAKEHIVQMLIKDGSKSMVFKPSLLKINKGDKVIFKPTDKGHNSTSVFGPEGYNAWKGKTNKELSITLDKEGVYVYECSNHGVMGMVAVIQVGEKVNKEKLLKFAKKRRKKYIMNKDRLQGFIDQLNL